MVFFVIGRLLLRILPIRSLDGVYPCTSGVILYDRKTRYRSQAFLSSVTLWEQWAAGDNIKSIV